MIGTNNVYISGINVTQGGTTTAITSVYANGVLVWTPAVSPTITTTSFPNGAVGVSYSVTLAATGTTPITWTATTLPEGLTLSGNVISGTPTTGGTTEITVTATNYGGADTLTANLTVVSQPPVIVSANLPNATVGEAYTTTITAAGTAPITWTSSTLPDGLTLSGGTISGTPTTNGTTEFTVTATNAAGSDTETFAITVIQIPEITTTTLTGGLLGVAYSATITANGTTPITWSATGVPSGLSLNAATGVLSGTPTTSGSSSITVTATNASGSDTATLSLTISSPTYTWEKYNAVITTTYSNDSGWSSAQQTSLLDAYGQDGGVTFDSSSGFSYSGYYQTIFNTDAGGTVYTGSATSATMYYPSAGNIYQQTRTCTSNTTATQGATYYGTVTSTEPNAYPNSGVQGGYWYEKI